MRRLVAVGAMMALFLVGCGDGGGDDVDPLAGGPAPTDAHAHGGEHTDHAGNPTSHCEPSGTSLTIAAQSTRFDKDCLAAPAGRPFTINFDNKDQTVHNIMILESHSATEALFDAGTIPNGIRTLNVPALQAGTFAFHCKIHPGQMSGTFVVA
ncbi:MAG TPA: cupredoxin domain-containing protein [Acidimicrobiales bacterium]|nr:cupredoxin domain-containing protein [Acidimicrobiales bacterium]